VNQAIEAMIVGARLISVLKGKANTAQRETE
jgi:hypothetical protein